MRISTEAKKWKALFTSALVAAVVLSLPARALATPVFSLDTAADWEAALNPTTGTIKAVEGHYPALDKLYGESCDYTDFIYPTDPYQPELFVYPGVAGPDPEYPDLDAGLVMSWGDSSQEFPQVGAWEYTYPEDPDLTGTQVKLTILAPPPPGFGFPSIIKGVSLTLNDAAGGWASWAWNVTPSGGLGPIIEGTPTQIVIDPTSLTAQPGATTFATSLSVGGPAFDVTQVTTIQADELAAVPGAGWATFQPINVAPGAKPWNYWSGLQVVAVPEPMTMLAVGLGVASLGGYIRKRRMS